MNITELNKLPEYSKPDNYSWDMLPEASISAYMVCKNEIQFIDLAICSVAPYVEDFVIVDTGSIDGTFEKIKDLAKQFTSIKVFERRIENFDLSEVRNYAMKQCQYDTIMVVDGDEVYDEQEIIKIKKWFSIHPKDAGQFGARLLSVRPIGDFKKAEADIYMVRLIRRQPHVAYRRIWPADDIFYNDFPLFVKLPYLPIYLFHLASVKPYHVRLHKWATYHALSFWEDKIKKSEIPDYFSMADMRQSAKFVNHVHCQQAPLLTVPIPDILKPHIERIERDAQTPNSEKI